MASVFKGFLDEIVPAQTGEGFDMTCVAFDMMKICLNGIEKPNRISRGIRLLKPENLASQGPTSL